MNLCIIGGGPYRVISSSYHLPQRRTLSASLIDNEVPIKLNHKSGSNKDEPSKNLSLKITSLTTAISAASLVSTQSAHALDTEAIMVFKKIDITRTNKTFINHNIKPKKSFCNKRIMIKRGRDRPQEVPVINQDPEFFDVFLPDRTSHQMIPPEFLKHFEQKIPKTIILKDLSGRVWHVDTKQRNNGVFMENGWNRFVNDNTLELGQFMVFRYSKQSTTFTVRIFGRDACKSEDQASEKPLIRVKEEEESDQHSTPIHQPKRKRGKP